LFVLVRERCRGQETSPKVGCCNARQEEETGRGQTAAPHARARRQSQGQARPRQGCQAAARRRGQTPRGAGGQAHREPKRAPRPLHVVTPAEDAAVADISTDQLLTPEEVEQFRQLLLEKRAEILGDVSTLHNEALNKDRRDAAGDLSSMPIHMADLGSDNYELEFTLGLIEGERAILKEIDEALERIRNNTYGICLATGKPIGKARLKAKPWAKYSYEYTLAQEQGQARRF
jgi:RNA polymerase-binding protein DksA